MFWRFGGYANVSTLDTILDKPDLTVEELLEESDLIQELKQQNSKLVEYLRDENVLDRLLRYVLASGPSSNAVITEEESSTRNGGAGFESEDAAASKAGAGPGVTLSTSPGSPSASSSSSITTANTAIDNFFAKRRKSRSKSMSKPDSLEESPEEAQRKKYAYIACEILSSEVWSISEALMENASSMRDFWTFLKRPAPLDTIQAGYFNKINEALLDRKTDEMLEFIKSVDNVVPDLVTHVDCPPIMDLLLKMISLEKMEGGQGIVDWLQSQNLIPILLSYLSHEHSSATQTSAGDFLKAIITISANATTQDQSVIGPNELTRQLVSEPCIKTLIGDMLRGGSPLTVGVGIVIEVIRKNNSDYDLDSQIGPVPRTTDPIYLGTLLRQFAKSIPNFMNLILSPDRVDPNDPNPNPAMKRRREIRVAFGEKIEPLGFDRFKTCELMAELLHCSNMALLNERGSEAEVRQRDAERERLKAEGRLVAVAEPDSNAASAGENAENEEGELGTSVDSAGFHHARVPSSNLSDSPDEIRRLEVQNAGVDEEEFEKVNKPETQTEDREGREEDYEMQVVDDEMQARRSSVEKKSQQQQQSSSTGSATSVAELVQRLELNSSSPSPSQPKETGAFGDSGSADENTPTSSPNSKISLLTQSIREGADIPEHAGTALTSSSSTGESEEQDRPAPLFQGKDSRQRAEEGDSSNTDNTNDDNDNNRNDSSSTGTDSHSQDPPPYTPESGAGERTVMESEGAAGTSERPQTGLMTAAQEPEYGLAYEVDIDGTPVVGDLLKMMFVEHRVVPTILVSCLALSDVFIHLFDGFDHLTTNAGLFLPLSLEQFPT